MKSVNHVTLLGHVGMLENKTLDGDKCVANFSVATNTQWLDKAGQKQEAVEWHRCVAWGKLGERAGQFLKKGSAVYLEGHLKTRNWTDDKGADHYSTTIEVGEFSALDGRADAPATSHKPSSPSTPSKSRQ